MEAALPNQKESPQYVRLSLAADMTLGFRRGRFWREAKMTCVNLLLTYADGCRANCSYCGLARGRVAEEKTFIHVPWPVRSLDEIIERLCESSVARRTCISMITHPRAKNDTLEIARRLTRETHQAVSVLAAPSITDKAYFSALRDAGVEKIGIAIDAATEELFDRHRGKQVRGPHRWNVYWNRFADAVEIFGPGRVGSHFIVGLGEREEDLVRCFQRVRDLGGVNHLFSFFPEQKSALADYEPPPLDTYRRVQVACHLIDEGLSSYQDFKFDPTTGRIAGYGVSDEVLHQVIDTGEPFRTRGCKGCDGQVDCNRPFGNSYPGPALRNYPFKPTRDDLSLIRRQMEGELCIEEQTPQVSGRPKREIVFCVPNFKQYCLDSYSNRGRMSFLAASVTGPGCPLQCDHCQARLLKPMAETQTPEALWGLASQIAEQGGEGLLVSGGCTREGIVPLGPLAETLARIKTELGLKLAVHSKFVSRPLAQALAGTRLDAVMVDLPTSEEIIQDVFHLPDRGFKDIEQTLNLLEEFKLPAAPHLLLGFDGEADSRNGIEKALGLLQGRSLQSLVVIFLMPLPGTPMPQPPRMPLKEADTIFAQVRTLLPDCPTYLGCARPSGDYQVKLETLALKHRFAGIAFPAEETIALAKKRKYEIQFQECCCAIAGMNGLRRRTQV